MAGIKNFQTDNKKYKNGISDIYKRRKSVNKATEENSKSEFFRNKIKLWTSFYRTNPHRFIIDYFGIQLKLFQMILIFMMDKVNFFMYLAARGQGKSWLIATYACARAVLYPSSQIIIASGTKGQARLIIAEKIERLRKEHPNLAREIKHVNSSKDECKVYFQNGSTIEAVVSTDNSRGYRGNLLIAEEFRMIKSDILQKVLRKFLTVPRQPKYLHRPQYKHLQESNKEIYISSAWYKNHWSWEKVKAFKNMMIQGKKYFVCGLPYKLSIEEGLLTQEQVDNEMMEDDFDPISWMMEMDCLFFGESENAFYKLNEIQECREIVKPFYPIDAVEFIKSKNNKTKKSTKQEKEIRIIGVDVAMMGTDKNDNTIFTCMRLLPNGEHYIKQVPYLESMSGAHSETQAIRLKQLFYDFEADFVAMDTLGNGISLFDDCSRVLYDEERDVEYPAWTAMNNEEMKNRALDKNALPIIYSIKVVKQELNHEIAMYLKTSFEKKTLMLLVDDLRGREYLIDKQEYTQKSPEAQANLLKPYVQTTILVNELVNLEYEIKSGFIKVKEVGRNRKDRFSSLAYCNYLAKILEAKLKKKSEIVNPNNYMLIKKPVIYKTR